jgi:Fe-Mn family superoxide dismutase
VPTGEIGQRINERWGTFAKFKDEFSKEAKENFGSGWTWLVMDQAQRLDILNTPDAETPMAADRRAIAALDTWEHAYYIDYRNERSNYIAAFWKIINWDFVNENL